MAAFESLRSLFEKPLPESPTLMESLAWNQIKAVKPPDDRAAFTEIFGELHFEERRPPAGADPLHGAFSSVGAAPDPDPAPPTTSPWLTALDRSRAVDGKDEDLRGDREDPSRGSSPDSSASGGDYFPLDPFLGASSNQSSPGGKGSQFPKGQAESFQLCTEGLGFESSDDVEDSTSESGGERCWKMKEAAAVDGALGTSPPVVCNGCRRTCWERRPRTRAEFPPPITCIGSGGKPCIRFSSHREGGRFVLREVRLPHRELLHASRRDGRLKLHFVQPDEEIIEEAEEEEEGKEEEFGGED